MPLLPSFLRRVPIPAWIAPVRTIMRKLAQQHKIINIVLPASTQPV
ncbi:hypothetical protein EVA_19907 [gut metagenome]|uniref:Uncharacterized protein n=1 Tax=gut metagenome TaxID=749906 RepID=J9FAQ0_9ZZZZ